MKKLALLFILVGMSLMVLAQPILIDPIIDKELKKIDDKTLEVTTTTTTVDKVLHDKAELQTRLAHIPERIAALQERIDDLNEEAAELQTMLDVLK